MKKFGAKKIGALAIAMALVTVGGVYATWTFSGASSTTGTSSITVGIADIATTTTGSGQYSIATKTGGTVSKIYTVDQYSSAITNIYNSSSNTSGAYQYVVVMHNGTTYYIYDDNGTVKYTTDSSLSSGTELSGSSLGIDDHTAALCIAYDATITITYTADSSDTGSSAYNYGVNTQWSFSWAGTTDPQLKVNTSTHLYDENGTETSLFTLDSDTYTIYALSVSNGTKYWTQNDPNDGVYTYILEETDLFTYLKVANEIIIDTTDGYDALNSVLSNDNIKLNIVEAGSTLATPSVSCVTTANSESITITDSDNTSGVECYYIGFMSGSSDGTPVYSYTTTTTGSAISFSDMLTSNNLLDGNHDGTYYIRVRAVADSDSGKANSTWSTAAYTVTVTTVGTTTSYTVAAIQ